MQLSSAEKRIYKYLISTDISKRSADSIAEDLFVSRTSLYRVCKKMGYSSFSHFKFAQTNPVVDTSALQSVNSLQIFEEVQDEQMEPIIRQLIAAQNIFVYGTNATSLAAHYLVRQLVNLGFFAVLMVDEFEFASRAHTITNEDCIICFSNSGQYYDKVYDLLARVEAQVIAITRAESRLAKAADLAITFDFEVSKADKTFDRENIFNLIVVTEKLLVNLQAMQPRI